MPDAFVEELARAISEPSDRAAWDAWYAEYGWVGFAQPRTRLQVALLRSAWAFAHMARLLGGLNRTLRRVEESTTRLNAAMRNPG